MANELQQFKSEFREAIGQLKSLVDPSTREKMQADRKTSLENYQNEVSDLKSQIKKSKKELTETLVKLKKKKDESNNIFSELDRSIQAAMDASKDRKTELESDIDILLAAKTEAGLKLQEREKRCGDREKELDDYEDKLRSYGDDLDLRGNELTNEARDQKRDREDIDRQFKTLSMSKAQLKESESRINSFKKELDGMSEKLVANKSQQDSNRLSLEAKASSVAKMEKDVRDLLSSSKVSEKEYQDFNRKESELVSRGESLKSWESKLKDQDRENAIQARALRVEAANIHNREKAVKALELELTN